MKEHKTIWFPFLRYSTPASLQHWLEGEAKNGWYAKLNTFSCIMTRMEKGEPEDCQYFMDFRFRREPEYEELFGEFSWEKAGRISNIVVWRRKREGTDAPVYSAAGDEEIRRRLLLLYYPIWIPLLLLTILCVFLFGWRMVQGRWLRSLYNLGLACVAGVFTFLLGKAIRRNRQQEREE